MQGSLRKDQNHGIQSVSQLTSALTCPCALVTSCPVAPCRLDRAFPNT